MEVVQRLSRVGEGEVGRAERIVELELLGLALAFGIEPALVGVDRFGVLRSLYEAVTDHGLRERLTLRILAGELELGDGVLDQAHLFVGDSEVVVRVGVADIDLLRHALLELFEDVFDGLLFRFEGVVGIPVELARNLGAEIEGAIDQPGAFDCAIHFTELFEHEGVPGKALPQLEEHVASFVHQPLLDEELDLFELFVEGDSGGSWCSCHFLARGGLDRGVTMRRLGALEGAHLDEAR